MQELVIQKCAHRNLGMPSRAAVDASPRRLELESEWENMLGHQLLALPPLETYLQELSKYFDWLEGNPVTELNPIQEVTASDSKWQQPEYISLPAQWGLAGPLEIIRFAGANRLRIQLQYLPEEGAAGVLDPGDAGEAGEDQKGRNRRASIRRDMKKHGLYGPPSMLD